MPASRPSAYTATLIRDSGSGLEKLFHDQLRTMGGLMRNANSLVCHEGIARGEEVAVGNQDLSAAPGAGHPGPSGQGRRCALRLSCRTAAAAASPYRVTLEPGMWNDRDTYCTRPWCPCRTAAGRPGRSL